MPDGSRMTDEALKVLGRTLSPEDKNIIDKLGQGQGPGGEHPAWGPYAAALILSTRIEKALDTHAKALIRSAEASEKHAVSLKWATWALVVATIALVLVTLGLWQFPQ